MSKPSTTAATLSDASFTFLSRREYFEDLIARISKTQKGDRVLLVTHDFRPAEPRVAQIMKTLSAAAKRGVNVHFALDERTFPVMQKVPITSNAHTLIHSTHAALETLQAAGGAYAITNKTYHRLINRFSGRAHIKVAIINDLTYIGGCNLTDANHIDMMVRWSDRTAANWLHARMSDLIRLESSQSAFVGKDTEFMLDPQTKLLLDAGKPRQSIILDNALRMIDEAKEWVILTCQYFPNGLTAQHLAQAYKRGVNVGVYYNHPSIHKPGFNALMHLVVIHERTKHPAALFARQLHRKLPYLHAKLLATEQGAMVGSHNYVVTGVNLGTSELTLMRHDPAFANQARQFLERLVGEAKS